MARVHAVLFLTTLLLGGMVLMIVGPQSGWSFLRGRMAAPMPVAIGQKPPSRKGPEGATKSIANRTRVRAVQRAVAAESLVQADAPVMTVIAKPVRTGSTFPLPRQVRLGTARAAIEASFGPPEASVVSTDVGSLREMLIYGDQVTGRNINLYLVNGVLTSIATVTQ